MTNEKYNEVIIKKDKKREKQLYPVKVFSKSREMDLLNLLHKKKEAFYDKRIINKFFNIYEYEMGDGKSHYRSDDLFLKNKYLYLTTRGVLNYLRLYEHQKATVNKHYYAFEIEMVSEYVKDNFSDIRSIVSLGAANSDKEISIFRNLKDVGNELTNINYFPVDISDHLIRLGILNISSDPSLKMLPVTSIIGDFWDLADFVKEKKPNELFEDKDGGKKRLFLLFGGTFGNYTEKELLNQIIQLMNLGDELIISVKLKKGIQSVYDKPVSIGKEYDYPEDVEFLLEPLTYIPYYYGYTKYNAYSLKKGNDYGVMLMGSQKNFISVVPDSECYAPYIMVEGLYKHIKNKLRLAWTTRYDLDKLEEWINGYRSDDNGYFCFNVNETYYENDYALLRLEKKWFEPNFTEFGVNEIEDAVSKIKKLSNKCKVDLYNKLKLEPENAKNIISEFNC